MYYSYCVKRDRYTVTSKGVIVPEKFTDSDCWTADDVDEPFLWPSQIRQFLLERPHLSTATAEQILDQDRESPMTLNGRLINVEGEMLRVWHITYREHSGMTVDMSITFVPIYSINEKGRWPKREKSDGTEKDLSVG